VEIEVRSQDNLFAGGRKMYPQFLRAPLSSLIAIVALVPFACAQDIFVTPIPNAPFSAVIDVQRSFVQPDGTVVNVKTLRLIARDGRGRIHNEARELVPVSSSKTPQVRRIHLYDPQTRMSATLDPQQKTYWTTIVNRPPATVPPALLAASPVGDMLPANEFTKQEDLGMSEMEGVSVHGVRQIQTIPAEASGTGKETVVTDEYWYSEELRINTQIKHNDPRMGSVTMTVTQVSRREPNASMFEIPSGYNSPNQ
jgi:hypothetical protein